jgi:protein O-mannosyl-transferase
MPVGGNAGHRRADRLVALAAALVGAVAFAVFVPAVRFAFLDWDDVSNFTANAAYRGLGPAHLRWMATTFHMGHYIPVTWLTFGLDHALWGMDPAGYHLTNVLLHAVGAVLCFAVVRRLLLAARVGGAAVGESAVVMGAAFASLVFAVHPLRVESVAWVTERRDVLSGVFYLGALLAYLRWCAVAGAGASRAWYLLSLAVFLLGVLSKSIVVTLPAVLLLLDVYPLRRLGGAAGWGRAASRVYLEKLPFLLLALAVSALAFVAVQRLGNMVSLARLDAPSRVALACRAALWYLGKTVAPLSLSPLYEAPDVVDPWSWTALSAAAAVLTITVAALAMRRRCPGLPVAWLTFLVTLLPVSGIFQNGPQLVADRYTYLACLGWAALAGAGVTWALVRGRRSRTLALVVAVGVVGLLVTLTERQLPVWRDSLALWSHAARVDPGSLLAANNLGAALLAHGRTEEAAAQFRRTVREVPGDELRRVSPDVARLYEHAEALQRAGRAVEAEAAYRAALAAEPALAGAWNNIGALHAIRADYPGALDAFLNALAVDPRHAAACANGRRAARILERSDARLARCDGAAPAR